MSKTRRRTEDPADDSEIFSDADFDLDDFVDAMEKESTQRRGRARLRTSRQRVDDLRDTLWLRGQLEDWDDWEN